MAAGRGISRRRLLAAGGAAAVGVAAGGARAARRNPPPKRKPVEFTHGVASGDPLSDRVILWTRAVARRGRRSRIRWQVASDERLRRIVAEGSATARRRNDWTVKVDATGLEPGRTYWYRFTAPRSRSPIGRTRTAPAGSPKSVRLAVLTCADYSRGLYNAYARVAERDDIDAVLHLGDYIYEGFREDRVRRHEPPTEVRTRREYRRRYASYRSDPALASLHARHPMIWVWDDHETCNGTWRDGADPSNHDPEEDGPFGARKRAALRAALEWLPIRSPEQGNRERIYRRFAFGDLIDLFMIDTRRIGRDRQGEPNVEGGFFTQTGEFADPDRQILGAAQEEWLYSGLRSSAAAWRLIGNQVVLSHIKVVPGPAAAPTTVYANPDQWDGYRPAQERLLDVLGELDDVVVLTGDVHASMAFEITPDPNNPAVYDPATSRGTVAVELVTPSISSAGDPQAPEDAEGVVESILLQNSSALSGPNPHLKYADAARNGYLLVDVDRERVRAEFWLVPTVTRQTDEQALDRAFTVRRGEARLTGQPDS